MGRILKCNMKVEYNKEDRAITKDDIILNTLLSFGREEKPQWVQINLSEVLQMLDCKTSVRLKFQGIDFHPNDFCNPGRGDDFPWCISLALRLGYCFNAITNDEYIKYVKYHYNSYYKQAFYTSEKMCQVFFNRFFSEHSKKKYGSYDTLFERYSNEIIEKGSAEFIKHDGEHVGFYVDDFDRTRPRTSPIRYERIVPEHEKLWVCFIEEQLVDNLQKMS